MAECVSQKERKKCRKERKKEKSALPVGCRDGFMNDFLSWCRHLLISFLFHDLTSLHPLSFHGNDFSTCSTHFSLSGKAPTKRIATPRRVHTRLCTCAQAHTDYARAHAPIRDHAENGVVHCSSVKNLTVYPGDVWLESNDHYIDVRAHLSYLWRRLVKTLVPQLVPVRR